jgi:hypothetical protein
VPQVINDHVDIPVEDTVNNVLDRLEVCSALEVCPALGEEEEEEDGVAGNDSGVVDEDEEGVD